MATKRGGGDQIDPTKGTSTGKTAGTGVGGGATGKTTSRAAASPNGPASPTAETGATRRAAAAKATSGPTTGSTRAAAGGKAAAGGRTAAGGKTAEGAKAGAGGKGTTRAPARGAAKTADSTARKTGGRKPDLKKDLRDFASTRPEGWSHDDWLRFLDDLQARGHNINDRDQIGSMLEKERLALALERIPGLSAPRARTIAERYGYLWRLKETDADQLSSEAKIPRPVAEKVLEGLRS
jgi:hypothetical protein